MGARFCERERECVRPDLTCCLSGLWATGRVQHKWRTFLCLAMTRMRRRTTRRKRTRTPALLRKQRKLMEASPRPRQMERGAKVTKSVGKGLRPLEWAPSSKWDRRYARSCDIRTSKPPPPSPASHIPTSTPWPIQGSHMAPPTHPFVVQVRCAVMSKSNVSGKKSVALSLQPSVINRGLFLTHMKVRAKASQPVCVSACLRAGRPPGRWAARMSTGAHEDEPQLSALLMCAPPCA